MKGKLARKRPWRRPPNAKRRAEDVVIGRVVNFILYEASTEELGRLVRTRSDRKVLSEALMELGWAKAAQRLDDAMGLLR